MSLHGHCDNSNLRWIPVLSSSLLFFFWCSTGALLATSTHIVAIQWQRQQSFLVLSYGFVLRKLRLFEGDKPDRQQWFVLSKKIFFIRNDRRWNLKRFCFSCSTKSRMCVCVCVCEGGYQQFEIITFHSEWCGIRSDGHRNDNVNFVVLFSSIHWPLSG